MKRILKTISTSLLLVFLLAGCSDFEEINTRPDAFGSDEVSAKYFLTGIQIELYAPNRFPYWRAQLIHADRYAGQFTFGFNGCWWSGSLGYNYSAGYTDATYNWMAGYVSNLSVYQNFVGEGGDLENQNFYALGLIMKGLYYQMYTDTFGMVPYSEALDPDIITPKLDSQSEIYRGVIADLDQAMSIIGDQTETGSGIEFLAENDLFFNGDMQQWKKMANTLKLRMALRAQGAPGADFAETAISEALQAPLLTTEMDNALMEKDTEIDQFGNAAYGDIWHNFGGIGSKWNVGKTLIDYLRDNNDPRLSRYAKPIKGGEFTFTKPAEGAGASLFDKHVEFILDELDNAGVDYTKTGSGDEFTITVADDEDYYVGQPSRLNPEIYPHVKNDLFSEPADWIINPKNQGQEIFPEVVFTAAEGNFLQAEAIIKGFGTGDAQALYQEGIRQAMKVWRVDESEIEAFIANEEMALLNGTDEENLEKIAIQRWIVSYTDGFEAWAIVRDTGYPAQLANGVSDYDIYSAGTLNGEYPQRMRYGNQEYNTNGANVEAAIQEQGPDEQGTELWWAD
ncbi:SusD/RagB family nutrient-binding outer membrane lipoprotein [Salegentibacter maritimus]|uniref:SusD/RagB family nutrient-binding outer membrane lipoprotein n=1 Tax=Salegentibacter maritimus TaxID=2794347 RepID=A0ABS0TDV7_9FLAO|nr:SusD/RagB family nutrient-binding outer membrane lipoprotein [Salegentibacter maritimus]MBI6115512.1 SusD/RagB family nutrient-binding outer membrane lipoprotein [Salegentibacter maritimus]MBI6119183.1 SusD/RagB family nutrient-binding outer membrane lipoprotein [Salegentibacter maritimus]